jgi:hypothetical protein
MPLQMEASVSLAAMCHSPVENPTACFFKTLMICLFANLPLRVV